MAHYLIPTTSSSGVFNSVKGGTPLSALNALGKNQYGKSAQSARALLMNDDGTRVSGVIYREGRQAYFSVDEDSPEARGLTV